VWTDDLDRHAAFVGWVRKTQKHLTDRQTDRHRFRLEDNIKMDLGGLSMEMWIGLS
jgi:hypothetical protein